ncbi:ABC transporter substrate-binding protein [uncultured Modestobacter sp.]|uniref:ABC transporter substrate-binding protein n=1 Tax=uncultured Modestobacter sp. TaxID=380048 RepID=UPI0026035F8C|nr:ABC transporter substrate-binding protein [uncultured Modestobacter sp.]
MLGAALLSVVLVTAACGSDDASDDGGSAPDPAAAAAALGEDNPASGDPIKLGVVSDGQTEAFDTNNEILAAEAVIAYANDHLGGLGGHPIELVTCETKGTPAGAQDCGNQFINEGVLAISGAVPGQIDPVVNVLSPAGIPTGLQSGSSQVVLQSPDTYVWSNPLSVFGTPAAYARENDISKAAMLVIDVPGAAGPAKQLGPVFFGNADADLEVIAIPPGTPDMTPQVQQAENNEPEMYYLLGDPTFCAGAIKALKTLNVTVPIVALDRCLGEDAAASIPGGYEGVTVATGAITNADDPEFELFNAVIDTYGEDLEAESVTISAYQGMLGLIRAVNASELVDLTPAGVSAAIKAMPATDYPLGGGATYQCNAQAVADISPNICSTFGAIADADAEGALSNFEDVDAEGIYVLSAG